MRLFVLAGASLSILFCLILSAPTLAQDTMYVNGEMFVKKAPKPKYNKALFRQLHMEANQMMLENFNDTALRTLLILSNWDPSNANVNYKIGQLYLKTVSEKPMAVEYLERALPKVTRSYDPYDVMIKKCPENVYFLLGQAYHLTYRFDEALAMFDKFSKVANMNDAALASDLRRRMEMCKNAKVFVESPIKCNITNLGDSINTALPEYGAIITADESQLFFTSRRFNAITGGNDNKAPDDSYYEDIWVSDRRADGTWGEARSLSTRINSWYNEAVVGLSADGQQLFLFKNDKGGSIYYSRLEGDEWSYAYMLGTDAGDITDINTNAWEPSACLAPDGSVLYFVSDRPGGYGGRDIYKCVKLPNGRWSKATNLGPTINTPYDEDAPFMHPDGVTMFFSSNGHKTMGGFDIFFSVKGDSGWFPPQSMGYPINTTDDDIFYVMSTDGKRAYFSSVRPEGRGDKDIYMVTLPQRVVIPVTLMKGYISFLGKSDTLSTYVTITATDMETGDIVQEVHPNSRTMKYVLPLNPGRSGKTYAVKFEADGYRPYTEQITVSPEGEYREIDKDFDFKGLGSISIYGKVTTRSGEVIPGVKITIKNNITKSALGIYGPDPTGNYRFDLSGTGGESYGLTYEAAGYLTMNETLDLPATLSEYDFKKNIIMETAQMMGTISVAGSVKDQKEKMPVKNAKVTVTDNKTGKIVGTYTLNNEGEYYFNVQRGFDYNISYEAEGFLFQSENLSTPKDKTYAEIRKDILLTKITKGAKVVLNNIFFDSGKASLRKESDVELEKLAKFLNDQPGLKVEIGGHTDNKGKKDANLKLSQDRAEAVVQYLIIKGIDRARLIAQGYGDAQPVAPNEINKKPNLKGMQMNRRVEFKILEN